MKTFTVFLIAITFSITGIAQTQTELTKLSLEKLKKTEHKLESVYLSVVKQYSIDTLFIKNLNNSQGLWRKYYKAQLKAMFPNYPEETMLYGSIKTVCISQYAEKIVELRIKELELWLIGRIQGDCISSIKFQDSLPKYQPYVPSNK